MTKPCRGEIWYVEFDPAKGSEIAKTRPALVLSVDYLGKLPLKTVVPLTDWKDRYEEFPWFVCLRPAKNNGLEKISGADAFQVKSLSIERFKNRVGIVSESEITDVVNAVRLCIGS
ncbi:MAG: type II toxin-antitoxin system PemK/MazF family toxin [Spirochaetes bacterium]|nr:type II toxin-antitoxin system PemK/MazF family toxin [Spirochaetota bacterium]